MWKNLLLNKKILIAEDNPISQIAVQSALSALGGNADIAGSGTEALKKLGSNNYDLIIMDLQMPFLNGYETTTYIRNRLKNEIPIIGMTAYAVKDEDKKCDACGMNAYISKPFTREDLSIAIQKVLEPVSEAGENAYLLKNKEVSVDVGMLYDISGNDAGYVLLMVKTFLKNMPDTISKMEQSLEIKDWENLYKGAHFAKSSLSIIRVNDMLDWILKVEGNAKDRENLQTLPALLEDIKARFLLAKELLTQKFIAEPLS